jgi:hypothetical protein
MMNLESISDSPELLQPMSRWQALGLEFYIFMGAEGTPGTIAWGASGTASVNSRNPLHLLLFKLPFFIFA